MTEASRVCAKCGGAMTVGVVVDGLQGGQQMPYWVEGIPYVEPLRQSEATRSTRRAGRVLPV